MYKETNLSIYLFGKPAWELDELENGQIDSKLLKRIEELADELRERLRSVISTSGKLLQNGWEGCGTLYTLEFYKEISVKQAKAELKSLGIDLRDLSLNESEYEDEEGLEELSESNG